jgi:hypothetical protein
MPWTPEHPYFPDLLIQFVFVLLLWKPDPYLGPVLRKFWRILQRSSLALRSFQLLTKVHLLLLILPTEVEAMTMMTVATMILLILTGSALKACLVPPVMVKAPQVEVVAEMAVVVVVVRQVLLASPLLQIPMRLCLFRPSLLFRTLSTFGIDKPQLLVLQSRISRTQTPLMGLI